jgi:hypothetical protein
VHCLLEAQGKAPRLLYCSAEDSQSQLSLPRLIITEHGCELSWNLSIVTDLQRPPLMQVNREKIDALKRCAQEIARDLRSRDDVQISYLEMLEERDNDNLRLAQMLAG